MTEAELRDLQERVSLVNEMAQTPGWQMLLDRARHTMVLMQTRMIQGRYKDWDEYRNDVAYTDGVEFMMTLPKRLNDELATAMLVGPEKTADDE